MTAAAPAGLRHGAAAARGDEVARQLADGVGTGDTRAVARVISLVESGGPQADAVLAQLAQTDRQAAQTDHQTDRQSQVIGITGPPGVGKSSITSALASTLRRGGHRVAVLAVDPSSPLTGGALLGDRVRMAEHALDAGVFIRSLSSRGALGGLSAGLPQAIRVLEVAGFGRVIVETVGAGQSEVDVAAVSDATVVVVAPGMGDAIQAGKAGVLEVADLFVVNKADQPGAQEAARFLRAMVMLQPRSEDDRVRPVLRTSTATGEGIDELAASLAEHWAWLQQRPDFWAQRRLRRIEAEITAVLADLLRAEAAAATGGRGLAAMAAAVRDGQMDVRAAAHQLLADGGRARGAAWRDGPEGS